MRSRILIGLICGTLGGFLGYMLQEHLIDYNASIGLGLSAQQTRILVICVGGLIGLFLGMVDGIVEGGPRKLLRGMVGGAFFGFILGYAGFSVGNRVYMMLGGTEGMHSPGGIFGFAQQVIARSIGWALLGAGLGIGAAIVTWSPRRILHGAIGGFLGGLVGGFVFDLVAVSAAQPLSEAFGAQSGVHDIGGPSRAIGFTAIGACTGFFIGLVETLMTQAWVKVLAGRNEGRDYILSRPMSILGRDERADVPLYGDPSVAMQHAAIRADRNRHLLLDAGTPAGTMVNGQRLAASGSLLLRDGDMIQIGTHRVLFREKATASKVARPAADNPAAKPPGVPMPSHLCPFCGSPRDPSGGCLCTPVPAAPASAGQFAAPIPPIGGSIYAPPAPPLAAGYPQPTAMAAPSGMPLGSPPMPAGMPPVGRLVGLDGPYTGAFFALTGGQGTVGRDTQRDVVLAQDGTVSRSHARIASEQGQFVVYDDGSANGTFVNGQRVAVQTIVPGDIVQFGSSKFRFE